mgnify:CR=1 FL=1
MSFTSLYLASSIRPTIWMFIESGPLVDMNLPSGSSPSLNFLAKVWLIIATLPEPFRSASVNSRPLISLMPRVPK